MDRQREHKKTRDPFTSEAAKFKRAVKTELRRRQQREENVSQRRKIDEKSNEISTDDEEIANNLYVKLKKYKEKKALQKKLDDKNKKPIFKIGIPHHNLYLTPLKDDKLKRNDKQIKDPIDNKPKKISRVTERRLALKGAVVSEARCTRASKKLAASVSLETDKKQQPVAPKNPGINPTPSFGQFEIPIEPDTTKEQINKLDVTFVVDENTSNDGKNLDDIPEDEKKSESIIDDANNSVESVMLRVSSQDSLDSNEIYNKEIKNKHLNIQDKCTSPVAALFSPFITTSRGKSSARKEFKERLSMRTSCSPADDIPTKETVMKSLNISTDEEEHTAQYYRSLGQREANRLKELCAEWRIIQYSDDTPEESKPDINTAIGQAELLLNKKFGRFQQLVNNCESGKGEMLVRCRDLQGFWELVSREIADCDSRFYKLEILKNNNWLEKKEEEEEDEEVIIQKTKVKRKPINKKKNIVKTKLNTAPSQLKLFMEEQRKKNLQKKMDIDDEDDENIEENEIQQNIPRKSLLSSEIFVPSSPTLTPRSPMRRQPTESAKKMALASMKIAKICRTLEVQLDDSISYVNSHQTPAKGILKKFNCEFPPSEKQITKSTCKVNFNDTVDEKELPNDDYYDDDYESPLFKFNKKTIDDLEKININNNSMLNESDEEKICSLEKKKLTFDDSLSPDGPLLDDSIKSSSNNYFFNDAESEINSKEIINQKIPTINLISPTPRKKIDPKIPSISLTSPTPTAQRQLPIINIVTSTVDKKLRKKPIENVTDEIYTPRQLRSRSIKLEATPSANEKSKKTFDTSQLDLSALSTIEIVDKENNVQKKKFTARKSIKYEDVGNLSLNIPPTPRKSTRLSMKHASEEESNALSVTLPSTTITPRRKRK